MQEILIALADNTRRKIFDKLIQEYPLYKFSDKEKYKGNTVKLLSKSLKLSPSTISYHLKILTEARLVYSEDIGKWRHFMPNFYKLEDIANWFMQAQNMQNLSFKSLGTFKAIAIDENSFSELLSLVVNHEYSLLHQTRRNTTLVAYLKLKRFNIYYEILYSKQTKVLNIKQTLQNKPDPQLVSLVGKYIETLK